MLSGKPSNNIFFLPGVVAVLIIASFTSCTVIKNNPPAADKNFVFRTKINLIGNFSNEEKKALTSDLENQLDDSLVARRLDKLFWKVLKHPPVYDSANADKSILFMRALLKSYGYFNDTIYYHTWVKQPNWLQKIAPSEHLRHRVVVDFYVEPRKQVKLDKVTYNIADSSLQHLADSTKKSAYIKKGDPFAKNNISLELDRLTDLYRDHGYFRFSRNDLIGLWDTLDASLLQPTLDPLEQLEILQKLRARRENPTANLEIRLRDPDSTKLVKFYNGHITVYPDYTIDTIGLKPQIKVVKGITFIQYYHRFKPKILPPNIYLPHDSLYTQRRYLRTLNRLNIMGAWQLVSIDVIPRDDQDTIDYVIRLTPYDKYLFSVNLESSINQSVISGTLLGLGTNVSWQDKNAGKAANLSTSNVRYGVEFGGGRHHQFIQTQQIGISQTIYFPRAMLLNRFLPEKRRDNWRTVLSFNAANTERRFLFNLSTVSSSWGYEFTRGRMLLSFKVPNIEYSYLVKRDSLDKLIQLNPSLKNIFTDGIISSLIASATISGGQGNKLNVFKANIEESGLMTGMIRSPFLDTELYRFIKMDVEFARLIRLPRSSLAFRAFAGAGYELNSTHNEAKRNNLPFFKQYFSGGPNSMRAWGLRRLGPGSSIKDFSTNPDRYGDVQLEANIEYRFPLGTPFGQKVNGALFTDMGNVWFMKKDAGTPEEVFKLSRLGKDIAIGVGIGLRVDFNFLVIRFDYSYKVKDPSPDPADAVLQNKWFGYKLFKGDQFQLGIGYPFIF